MDARLPTTSALRRLDEPALLADQVFAALRTAILNGEVSAGARLRIRDIASALGTSVMPVREAIQRLEEAGLAERAPHRGAVVKRLTLTELVHVYEVRRVLEVEAARSGATRVEPPAISQMQVHQEQMGAAIDRRDAAAFLDHDEAFLELLYRASGNPVLTSTIRSFWERCRVYKIVGVRATLDEPDGSPLAQFNEQLLEACRRGDAARAAQVTDASFRDATSRIREQLRSPDAPSGRRGTP